MNIILHHTIKFIKSVYTKFQIAKILSAVLVVVGALGAYYADKNEKSIH